VEYAQAVGGDAAAADKEKKLQGDLNKGVGNVKTDKGEWRGQGVRGGEE